MNVSRTKLVLTLTLVGVFAVLSASVAQAEIFTYRAADGTTPDVQGWEKETANTAATIEVIGEGDARALHQVSIANVNTIASWKAEAMNGFDFTSSQAVVFEAGLQIDPTNGSDYDTESGVWRAGYTLAMTDMNNRHIILGISSDGVRMTTNNVNWADAESSSFEDTISPMAPNRFKLVAQNSEFKLFTAGADDADFGLNPLLTLKLGAEYTAGNRANTFRFGDISTLAGSDSYVSYVNASTVPEPGSLLLFAGMMGLGAVCYRRRKQR